MEIARFLVAEPVWCEEGPYGGPPLRDGAGGHGQGREKKPPRPKRPSPSQDTSPSELRATVGKATVEASEAIDSNLRLFRTACLGVMALSGAYIIYKSSAVRLPRHCSIDAIARLQRGIVPVIDLHVSTLPLCAPTAGEPRHQHQRALL